MANKENRDGVKKVLIIAGEASGDLHGANLVRELVKIDAGLTFHGVGSTRMREAGVTLLADASTISVVGITEVLTHLATIYGVFAKLRRFIREERPDLLVLIDFPDFNLRVGAVAKKAGVPVLYYISPQVWAWRKGRIRTIAGIADTMVPVFPFEAALYERSGVPVRFVGHPLIDIVRSPFTPEEARRQLGLDPARTTIAILPGSRRSEIRNLLPDMLHAARLLLARHPDLQFVLPAAPTLGSEALRPFLEASAAPVHLVDGRVYDVLRASDAAMVASGTATLETGLMSVPMVILYRVSWLTALIVRLLASYEHVGLVNIVAGKRVVPELLQGEVTAENIARELGSILSDGERSSRMRRELSDVRRHLGEEGASGRVAVIARELLERTA